MVFSKNIRKTRTEISLLELEVFSGIISYFPLKHSPIGTFCLYVQSLNIDKVQVRVYLLFHFPNTAKIRVVTRYVIIRVNESFDGFI